MGDIDDRDLLDTAARAGVVREPGGWWTTPGLGTTVRPLGVHGWEALLEGHWTWFPSEGHALAAAVRSIGVHLEATRRTRQYLRSEA